MFRRGVYCCSLSWMSATMSCDLIEALSNFRALPLQLLQRMAFFFFSIHFFFLSVLAQLTPVPPLQWINLSNLLQGSSPAPPLRDAAIGYDDSRLVFHPLHYL